MSWRLISLALAMALLAGCSAQPAASGDPPQATATPEMAADFSMNSLTGQTITLSELRGQWVLVNFWATWCLPCVSEMPYLQAVSEARDITVLGVNFQESASDVAEFAAQYNITFPLLLDPSDITVLEYTARSLPCTFVIAPDGTIALRIIGEIEQGRFDSWLDEHQIAPRQ